MPKEIEPHDFVFGVKVVDFGEARIRRGKTKRPYETCSHRNMVYDNQERRIWCTDCENDIEPFDAFTVLVENFHAAYSRMDREREEVKALIANNRLKVAAQKLSQEWLKRNTVPVCPHCNNGLLPEDFTGRIGTVWTETEKRRRQPKVPPLPPAKGEVF